MADCGEHSCYGLCVTSDGDGVNAPLLTRSAPEKLLTRHWTARPDAPDEFGETAGIAQRV